MSEEVKPKFPWGRAAENVFDVAIGFGLFYLASFEGVLFGVLFGGFGYSIVRWLVMGKELNFRPATCFLFGGCVIRHDVDFILSVLCIPCWAFLLALIERKWDQWFVNHLPDDETSS